MEQSIVITIIVGAIFGIMTIYFGFSIAMRCAKQKRLQKLLDDATNTDGAHHKQWYLFEIGKELDIYPNSDDSGIAP